MAQGPVGSPGRAVPDESFLGSWPEPLSESDPAEPHSHEGALEPHTHGDATP